jgi:hypothetical protein
MSEATEKVLTNAEFMKDGDFISACEEVNLKVTKRQASKFRMKIGKAYRDGRNRKVENNE